MELRYSELKYNGKVYTEQWKIDEILINNKFNWMVNAEIKNARLEIFQDTLVWNAGIWYNGDWHFGVWRDGEWRYGTWQNGVFYNGVWRNGTFKSGIIYNGKFFKGSIEGGEIRGGQFIDIKISPNVNQYTEEEFQEKQEEQIPSQVQPEQTNPDQVKVHTTLEKKIYKKMRYLKTFEGYRDEEFDEINYYGIKQYINDTYGIDGVSDSDIDEWIEVLKERGEDPNDMNYVEIADSMYDDFEERSNKDWEENE